MNQLDSRASMNERDEVSALLATLNEAGRRLDELMHLEIVAGADGEPGLLPTTREYLSYVEAARKVAVLDALPASIVLLSAEGRIVSVNEAWRNFADANGFDGPVYGIGCNYLTICDEAEGEGAAEARQVAEGIRSVLKGRGRYAIDYVCHSPAERRWFALTVTPLADDERGAAVVMHLDITERIKGEQQIAHLNRVHAFSSGIGALIVRVHDRETLFREACRIAVEVGAFSMAWIGEIDPETLDGEITARHGGHEGFAGGIRLTRREGTPHSEHPACRALRQSRPVICNDIATDDSLGGLREDLLKAGHRAGGGFPLSATGRPDAVLSLFSDEPNAFNREEVELLTELAGDISFALDHIEKAKSLHYAAYYDVLTGLANRTLFLERVGQHLRNAAGGGHKLALVMIDLQRFRHVNESLGRPAGDALLKQVAEWLSREIADVTLLARMSADRFAAVLPVITDEADAARLLELTIDAFQAQSFHVGGAVLQIAMKAGISLFPDDGTDAESLLRNAEAALRKATGRGDRYLFYAARMAEVVSGRLSLEGQLRQGVARKEFVLHYQPKVSLSTGKVTGAEALIRWNDPRTGLVPPSRFVPILEETGLIIEVGRWALGQAIEDQRRWREGGLASVRVAVNISALQLRSRNFLAEIERALGSDALAAAGLELEITESLIMEDVKSGVASLQAIRAMGVSVAIDDFGTGYSSLGYLSKLPLDTLKIDRSFVTDMTFGPEGLSLVSTIINLGHSLKLKVVAEGVESDEQSRLLRLLNCDEAQGFHFGRPVPFEVFETDFLGPLTAR